jgi:hypothetical protein
MKQALIFAVLFAVAATAQQPAPADIPGSRAADAAPSNTAPRDPFWPVGYTPPELAAPGSLPGTPGVSITEDDWHQAQKRLTTSSVFRTKDPATGADRFVALINGKVVGPGETIIVKHKDFTFRFKVTNITISGPQFERSNQ